MVTSLLPRWLPSAVKTSKETAVPGVSRARGPVQVWGAGGEDGGEEDLVLRFEFGADDVRCSMFDVRCSMFDVRCLMFDVRCSMFDAPYHPPPSAL